METFSRIMRYLKPMFKMLFNERGEVTVTDPPVTDPPAGDPPAWIDVLPEEAQKDPNITKYKTPEDFYKGYKSQTELLGRKGVIVPKDDAAPEEKEKFYNALGRPDKPEGYKFTAVENVHAAIKNPAEITQGLAMEFHKQGLNNAQADYFNKQFIDLLNQSAILQEKKQTEAMQATETTLRKDWGADYDKNKAQVGKVVAGILTPEELQKVGGAEGLGNNPVINKLIYKLASQLSEDAIKNIAAAPTTGGATGGNESTEQAKKKIEATLALNSEDRKKHAYFNENDPKHHDAVQEMARLYGIAYPNEPS